MGNVALWTKFCETYIDPKSGIPRNHQTSQRRACIPVRHTPNFSWQGFVSVTLGLFSVGLGISGITLFFLPPGRIANWPDWTFLGLAKRQWIGLHVWLALGFLILSVVHTVYNWKRLVSYFKDKTRPYLAFRWEGGAAVLLFCLVSVGTVTGIPPFSNLTPIFAGLISLTFSHLLIYARLKLIA